MPQLPFDLLLICNVADEPTLLNPHHPNNRLCSFSEVRLDSVAMPKLEPPIWDEDFFKEDLEEYAAGIHEWLSLVRLESPRVSTDDQIDSFLSRYSVPGSDNYPAEKPAELVRLRWDGFMSPTWVYTTFLALL